MSHHSLLKIDKMTERPHLWNRIQIAYFGFPVHIFFPELGTTSNTKVTLYFPSMVYNVNRVKQVDFKFDVQNNLSGKIFWRENTSSKWSDHFLE